MSDVQERTNQISADFDVRRGLSLGERVAMLEADMRNMTVSVNKIQEHFEKFSCEFDKVKSRLTFASGFIAAITVAMKMIPSATVEHVVSGVAHLIH